MILYINSCVREKSRTDRIARALLAKKGEYTELYLEALEAEGKLPVLSGARLKKRNALIEAGEYSDPMFDLAKQFAKADEIVISAPYWDNSFPAALKLYIENIYVTGIVSKYGQDGHPVGLCSAKKLIYVTTAGGPYTPDYSFGYITSIAKGAFGIPETELIKAEMLDAVGFDAETIVREVIETL